VQLTSDAAAARSQDHGPVDERAEHIIDARPSTLAPDAGTVLLHDDEPILIEMDGTQRALDRLEVLLRRLRRGGLDRFSDRST
jgi:hypothetical protein